MILPAIQFLIGKVAYLLIAASRRNGAVRRAAGAFLIALAPACASAQFIATVAGDGGFANAGNGGPAVSAQVYYPIRIAVAPDGSMYISQFPHSIRKVSPDGVIRHFAGVGNITYGGDGGAAVNAGLNHVYGMTVDAAGNVYVADRDNRRVRKIDTAGIITTVAGNGQYGFTGDGGPATDATFVEIVAVAVDAAGNLFIVDASQRSVRKVSPNGIITTVAGHWSRLRFSGDGGPAVDAGLEFPTGITLDTFGNMYIADSGAGRIRKVASNGIISTLAGGGTGQNCETSTIPTEVCLKFAMSSAVDTAGNVYIADSANHRIRKLSPNGTIAIIAGSGMPGYGGDGGPAINAVLNYPDSIVSDAAGNLYFGDRENNRVRRITATNDVPSAPLIGTAVAGASLVSVAFSRPASVGSAPITKYEVTCGNQTIEGQRSPVVVAQLPPGVEVRCSVKAANAFGFGPASEQSNGVKPKRVLLLSEAKIVTVAGTGFGGCCEEGIAATKARIGWPGGMATDTDGTLYFSDYDYSAVRQVNHAGIISTLAGIGNDTGEGVPARGAKLNKPLGVAVDQNRNVFVVDRDSNRVRKIDKGGIITTVAGTGVFGTTTDPGPATNAKLAAPQNVVADADGNIYIADQLTYRVRKVDRGGTITTVAGVEFNSNLNGDGGLATNAGIAHVTNVAVDRSGNLYVVAPGRIRKVTPDGIINTIAGIGDGVIESWDTSTCNEGGLAVNACLSSIGGIAVDADENVYFSEPQRHRIRMIGQDGMITTVAGTGVPGYSGDEGPAGTAQFNVPGPLAIDHKGNLYVGDILNGRIRKVLLAARVPAKPEGVTAAAGYSRVVIPFERISDDGGAPILRFDATCGSQAASSETSPITVVGVAANALVSCKVVAVNTLGESEPTLTPVVKPLAGLPGAPTILGAHSGNSLAVVSFTPSQTADGGAVASHRVTCNPGAYTATAGSSPIIVGSLVNGTTYACIVAAANESGLGPSSPALNVTPSAAANLELAKVVSRKTHGATGEFELAIDRSAIITGNVTAETRAIGGGHQIVFKFNGPVSQAGSVSVVDSQGTTVAASAPARSGNEVTVTLPVLPNARKVTISLAGTNGALDSSVSVGFLMGKVISPSILDNSDVAGARRHAGEEASITNFLFDVDTSGRITASDILAIKHRTGTRLP